MSKDGTTLPLPSRTTVQREANLDLPTLRITIVAGPDTGKTFEVMGSAAVVGRGDNAEVRLYDPTVSQFHLQMTPQPDGILVLDMRSRNGVWFAGAKLERALLPDGATINLGETALHLELGTQTTLPTAVPQRFGRLIGRSAAMTRMYPTLLRLAATELSVILQGPTGSGKEEIARALHAASPRAKGPFVVLDCTTLPESLATSILFGHVKGAFTGARESQKGLFEAADGGVLFVDELGDLPRLLQPLFLRAIENREIRPVGAEKARRVDIRVIGATWKDLRAMVNQDLFREDLYYRVAEATVTVPSLNERAEDIPLLVRHFLSTLPSTITGAREISPQALAALCTRHFPGNVRELRATVLRLAQLAAGPLITEDELQMESVFAGLRSRAEHTMEGESPSSPSINPPGALPLYKDAKRTAMDEFERHYLAKLVSRTETMTMAAALAGLQRANLRHLLQKHGLKANDGR